MGGYRDEVLRVIERERPQSLLCIGGLCDAMPPQPEWPRVTPGEAASWLRNGQRFDLVLAGDVLESLPRSDAEQLLARLRDLHGGHFLLLVEPAAAPGWRHNDLLALGLTLAGRYEEGERVRCLYAFDIKTYKSTPDWLNNRFWAHPERWDRDWW